MNRLCAPLTALTILLFASQSGLAQLPPTNMGKFVHQPGDNQYSQQTQQSRHGAPPPAFVPAPRQASGGGGAGPAPAPWTPTPRPYKPDISLEPIAADEPIAQPGFPPIPDRLELPITASNWAHGGYGGGRSMKYGGGGGGPVPGMPGSGGPPQPQGMHQHYNHFSPGAFMPDQPQSHYYKCLPVAPPHKDTGDAPPGDLYSAGSGNGDAAPKYRGSGEAALRAMGKEPKLSDRNDSTQAPDAPQPVVVNQSTTQDLSLPEDEFQARPNNGKRNPVKNIVNRVTNQAVSRGMGMTGMLHF